MHSTHIRPHKTDKIDSLIIADFIRYGDFSDTALAKLLLERVSLKAFAKKKLNELSSKAKNSFGITFGIQSLTLQLQILIAHISFIEEQISQLDTKIADLLKQVKSPITTIPGVGAMIGATILSEVGDISKFSSPAKLVAYAGLDAKISQSGTSQSTGKMTKRGSPYLRTAIFRAAFIASNSDPVFKAFYEKKRAEGKHHFNCIGAVARKLCYTIHAILSKNSPYEIQSIS